MCVCVVRANDAWDAVLSLGIVRDVDVDAQEDVGAGFVLCSHVDEWDG